MDSSTSSLIKEIITEQRLKVVFQPIADLNTQAIFGYEGLIRGPTNSPLQSPVMLFYAAELEGLSVELDYLCRALIIKQFAFLNLPGKLFINVIPQSLLEQHYRKGQTKALLDSAGISQSRVVIEITESSPIEDFNEISDAIHKYREAGFTVAIDDLGAGYSGLKLWSEMVPDFVKIDRHFIQDVDKDRTKRQFIRAIIEIAQYLGANVITEGIETLEEYSTLRKMGVEYVQGYYFSKPLASPPQVLPTNLFRSDQRPFEINGNSISSLIEPVPSIQPHTHTKELYDYFINDPQASCAVIVDAGKPVGLIRREKLLEALSSTYGRALYDRKPVSELMNTAFHTFEIDISLEVISKRLTNSSSLYNSEFFITDEGTLVGKCTLLNLLKKITDQRIETVRYSNPLTGLPGNVPIEKQLDNYIASGLAFSVAYIDLDNFKPFNDYCGYSKGDEMIKTLARTLKRNSDSEMDFVGHIGGDDFIVIFSNDQWEESCNSIIADFDQEVRTRLRCCPQENEIFPAHNRADTAPIFPLTSVSIGAVAINKYVEFFSKEDIHRRLTEAKSQAKAQMGSSFIYLQLGANNPPTTRLASTGMFATE
ncbi:MAG: EAL and GGDEF domain-containing protein [Pseudomonadales bacterium]|nr:EAL and GGDEF domain-containing protein [Pseudomonadales bacterium]